MPLDKTWEAGTRNELIVGASLNDCNKTLLLSLKNALTNPALTTPWVVRASSDSTAADLTDRWGTIGDLVGSSSSNRSWVVLRQAGILPTFDLCLALDGGGSPGIEARVLTMAVSPGGYDLSAVTPANRPPTLNGDEREILDGGTSAYLIGNPVSPYTAKLQVLVSDDGQVTRVFAAIANVVLLSWAFEVPRNPDPLWTNPWIARGLRSLNQTQPTLTYSFMCTAPAVIGSVPDGLTGNPVNFHCSTEGITGVTNGAIGQQMAAPSVLGARWPFSASGLYCADIIARGRYGLRFDWGFGSEAAPNGTHYPRGDEPGEPAGQWAQLHDVIVGWNSLTPIELA